MKNKYLDLKLGYTCNNNCVHCVIADQKDNSYSLRGSIDRTTQECFNEILESKKNGCSSVVLTGGEPTIREDFVEIAKFVKSEGMKVLLQSNGRKFCDLSFTKNSLPYIDFFMIALHSDNAETHDKITQRNGSFVETIAGLKNLVNDNCNVGIKIVISNYNKNDLINILKLVSELGIKYVNIAFPHANGNAGKYFDTVVPYYKDIKNEIGKCINFALDRGLNLDFESILPCALDRKEYPLMFFSDLKINKNAELKQLDSEVKDWNKVKAKSKKKDKVCSKCIFNKFCEGYWEEYVNTRGFVEFEPITTLPIEIKKALISNLKTWKK